MAIKIDMAKAYDQIEWSFLLCVLKKFGFDNKWIQWVGKCITMTSFSTLINGSPHGAKCCGLYLYREVNHLYGADPHGSREMIVYFDPKVVARDFFQQSEVRKKCLLTPEVVGEYVP
ncbi:hypothetical protein RJ639_042212 [Escallonia herrerae]|uniref:Reverse transcriptase n=1 Tax=Escallonia herrerae TaxID=1293975 RepID=A0AA89B4Q1_9ASTE|nr:hypothetical protein RJ639_042212 [Escallonia herrerae]